MKRAMKKKTKKTGRPPPLVVAPSSEVISVHTHLGHIFGVVRAGMKRIGVHRGLIVGAGLHSRPPARGVCKMRCRGSSVF